MNLREQLESVKKLPEGDYAECGVYKGDMAEKIAAGMAKGARLFLCDTFTGHPFCGEFDDPEYHPAGRYGDCNLAEVVNRFKDNPQVEFVVGEFSKSLNSIANRKFRYVNCDCDLYDSYKAVIEFFLPRMVRGGIIRFDDMVPVCPGAIKAVTEQFGEPIDYYTAS